MTMSTAGAQSPREFVFEPAQTMLEDVLEGLQRVPKRLPSKYFYDATGSVLFEAICEQPEYYLTRAELALMHRHVEEIAATLGPDTMLLEYGSGSGRKTELLLQHLQTPVAYVPIEISGSALETSVTRLGRLFPHVEMLPLVGDFTLPVQAPRSAIAPRRRVLYFPGSTLGNFEAREAQALLIKMREEVGACGGMLIGIDLKKDPSAIEAAYNDAEGVTAAFTLNMLTRLNSELGADFDLSRFGHRARYNALAGRIETHIVSRCHQRVRIGEREFSFAADEAILVEYSCKYSLEDFARMAARADLRVARTWCDEDNQFSVQYLVRSNPTSDQA